MSADVAVHDPIVGTKDRADIDSSHSEPAPTERVALFEVTTAPGEHRKYTSASELRRDIVNGAVPGQARARALTGPATRAADGGWTSVERLALSHAGLRGAYRPVWDTTLRFMGYGAIAGVGLKLLDTTITLFTVNESVGVAWLIVLGSLLLSSRWSMAPVAGVFFSIKAGVGNLFMAVLAASLVGFALGAPLGMILGTVVGYSRRRSAATADDAKPEGSRPYVLGLALPLLYLCVAIPGYIWVNLKVLEWLAR